jgi:siderophore synthetase component
MLTQKETAKFAPLYNTKIQLVWLTLQTQHMRHLDSPDSDMHALWQQVHSFLTQQFTDNTVEIV